MNVSFQIFPASCQWLNRILIGGSTDKMQMLWKASLQRMQDVLMCKCAAVVVTAVFLCLDCYSVNLLILCKAYVCKWLAEFHHLEDSYSSIIIYEYITYSFIQTAKTMPTAKAMAEPPYGFLVVVLRVLQLLYIIRSILCLSCFTLHYLSCTVIG